MLRAIGKEEELQLRQEGFAKLKPGLLFNLGQERFFIAVRKVGRKGWEVVVLTQKTKKGLSQGNYANLQCFTSMK